MASAIANVPDCGPSRTSTAAPAMGLCAVSCTAPLIIATPGGGWRWRDISPGPPGGFGLPSQPVNAWARIKRTIPGRVPVRHFNSPPVCEAARGRPKPERAQISLEWRYS